VTKPKALLFGASEGGRNALINYRKAYDFIAYVDNDKRKHGTQYAGLPVIAPENIANYQIDEILISSIYGPQIHRQLLYDLNTPKNITIRRVPVELLETNWHREISAFTLAIVSLLSIVALLGIAICWLAN